MEPKDKLHSESQEEIKNSDIQAENTDVNEPKDAVNETEAAEETNETDGVSTAEKVEKEKVEPDESKSTEEADVAASSKNEASSTDDEEKAADEVEEKSTVEVEDKSTDEVEEKSTVEVEDKSADEVEEKSTVEAEDKSTDEVEEKSTVEAEDKSTDEVEEKSTVEVEEKSTDDVDEKPADAETAEKEPEVAEEAQADEKPEQKAEKSEDTSKEEVDYSTLSEVELVNLFRDLLENHDFMKIHHKVDLIKSNFYKKHKANLQAKKKEFIDNGGFEEEFKPEPDPYENDLKELMSLYRQKKAQHNKQLEAEKEENLKRKYEIIEEIKNLVNREESINKTFQEFKSLQQQWHDVGLVPQAAMKDMWENYHHHVENFYDYIKINRELRDLDLKKNLEEKMRLCERAEALLLEPSVIKAFNALQKLHDSWREIGPVPREKKEELWERFKDATTKINKKHQEYFETRKKEQKKNLEAKTVLCEKVEEILTSEIENHKQWEAKSKEVIELQKLWRTIGFAPKKSNNTIYERFRTACDTFFDNKREFYAKHKEIQQNNLQLKIDLCTSAEAMKESEDWKKTTNEYIEIQKKWKEIGPVPRKHSDAVWKRFRAACDHFFNRKKEFFSTIDETQVENLKLKNDLIEEVKAFKPTNDEAADFEKLREFQRSWSEIGFVPIDSKNEVQKRFRDAVNEQFDKLKVDDQEKNLLKFKSKVTDWKTSNRSQGKVYAERDKHVNKMKHLENDLITLKNNIGFFSNSKNAEGLIKDVKRKIENAEEQIEYLKEKIRIIDQVDDEEDK